MIRRVAAELRRRSPPVTTCQAALLAAVLLIVLAWTPVALLSDIRGARANLRLSAAAAADARGPSAAAGTNLRLVHAAQRRIPGLEPFAIVRAGRWGSASNPNRSLAFVWQAGQSWTQFALAPRVQVSPRDAVWLLVRGTDPTSAGVRHPEHAWRFGRDWLVEVREVSFVGLLAANGILLSLGAGALMLTGTWDRLRPASRIAPSLLAGFASAAIALPPLIYAGVAPTPLVLGAITLATLATGLIRRRRQARPAVDASGGGRAFAAVAAVAGIPFVLRAASQPLLKFDAYADWTLKAKLLYGHGGLISGAFDSSALSASYLASHREYPLGLPSVEAFDFHLMGGADGRTIHLQFVLLAAAFAGTIWSLTRHRVPPVILAATLLLLFVAPSLHTQLLDAYADVPTACLWAASALAVALWLMGDGGDRLLLGALLAAGALAIKQEGLVLDGALFAVVGLVVAGRRSASDGRRFGLAAGCVLLTAVPWQLWVRAHHLHDADIAPSLGRMARQAHSLPTIVHRLGAELVWLKWPGIVALAVLAALILAVRRRDALAGGYLLLLALSMAGLTAVYWNARSPVGGLLAQSASRVVAGPVLLSVAALPLLIARLGARSHV